MTPPANQSPSLALLVAWLDALGAPALEDLARRYRDAAREGGATMRKPDGRAVPIPPLLTPEVLDEQQLAGMEANAHALVAGLSRLTAWLMSPRPETEPLRARMFPAFGMLEAEALRSTWREAERLCTARVDYLVDEGGVPRALEVNATIPAMQGYSDIVASAFVHEVGRVCGHGLRACELLLDANGRNGDQLLASLLAHYQLLGGTGDEPRIAIVAREGDSQLGELGYLAARWSLLGCETRILTPGELRLDGARLASAHFMPELVYRHVFARRLEPDSDFARACLRPSVYRILNPIASHLELKGMLGLLSQAAAPGGDALATAIGLDDEVRREVSRSVPWTRLLVPGPATGPGGEAIADLVATVAGEPERFVVKRSWDYGGKSVFLGLDHDAESAERAGESLGGRGPTSWADLVHAAAADTRDIWVVQGLVRGARRRHLVADEAGPAWKDLYVDLSVYTNLGVDVRPHGGVSRASQRRIVNLQGGGGLAPLIRAEVLDQLIGSR